MTKKIIFITSFNTSPFTNNGLTKEWNDYRFDFWLKWTYPSIMNQTYSDIEYWLFCNDALKEFTEPYKLRIDDARCRIVYKGEMWQEMEKLKSYDYYILPRIDSDDLYHESVADFLIQKDIPDDKRFYQFTHGYAYDVKGDDVFYWSQASSPFYAFIFGKDFPKQRFFWFIDHTEVYKFSEQTKKERLFCVMIHDKNTSTNLGKGYVGRRVNGSNMRNQIMKGFSKNYGSNQT